MHIKEKMAYIKPEKRTYIQAFGNNNRLENVIFKEKYFKKRLMDINEDKQIIIDNSETKVKNKLIQPKINNNYNNKIINFNNKKTLTKTINYNNNNNNNNINMNNN